MRKTLCIFFFQKVLVVTQSEVQHIISERMKELQDLKHNVDVLKVSQTLIGKWVELFRHFSSHSDHLKKLCITLWNPPKKSTLYTGFHIYIYTHFVLYIYFVRNRIHFFFLFFFQNAAQRAQTESDKTFHEMLQAVERWKSEINQMIMANMQAAMTQADGYVERLEQEIMELQRRDAELRQILETEDNIHFLQVSKDQTHLLPDIFLLVK